MKCPACGAEYIEGDRFCGTCGERLPEGAAAAAGAAFAGTGAPTAVDVQAAHEHEAACPVCGAGLASEDARCSVCGFEPGASVVLPNAAAAMPSPPPPAVASRGSGPQPQASARICPIHGPLDPSWMRCPDCLREGREGRIVSGPIDMSGRPAPAAAAAPPPALPADPPPRVEPAEATVPPAPAPAVAPPTPSAQPPPSARDAGDLPRSSVGATFVIRRRPRVLAYLIEREGEAVGRVYQLDEDVTDIGRDPRNHIVLSDVLISGFHARIERGPDGGFMVQDRNSTNGTFLNDEPLAELRPLQENDALRLGNTTLVLKVVS